MKALILALLLVSSAAFAQIHEIKKMTEILPYIEADTLVVFDLDNTVMETLQSLGSDQWYDSIRKSYLNQGMDKTQATAKAIGVWEKVQNATEMKAVEETTPALIRDLQSKGVYVMALTARPDTLMKATHRQLEAIGVKFDAMMMIGPNLSKGEELAKRIRQDFPTLSKVVFVDDKAKHTKTVDEAITRMKIENHEFRYGAADTKVQAFNVLIADYELDLFEKTGELISDEKAAKMMEDTK